MKISAVQVLLRLETLAFLGNDTFSTDEGSLFPKNFVISCPFGHRSHQKVTPGEVHTRKSVHVYSWTWTCLQTLVRKFWWCPEQNRTEAQLIKKTFTWLYFRKIKTNWKMFTCKATTGIQNNVINIMLFYYLFTVFYQCFALKLRFKFGFYWP